MGKRFVVFSTLTADNVYADYATTDNDIPKIIAQVLIKGGTGVASKHLITPRGVMTDNLTEEDVALLKRNHVFKIHEDNGFVKIEEHAADPEKVAADMASRDGSAPLEPGDFDDDSESEPQPSTGKVNRTRK